MYSAILKALENKTKRAIHEANVQAYYESEDRIREAFEQYRKEQEYKKYIDQLIEEDYIQSQMEFDQEHDDYMAKMIEEQERKAQAFFLKLQEDERGE